MMNFAFEGCFRERQEVSREGLSDPGNNEVYVLIQVMGGSGIRPLTAVVPSWYYLYILGWGHWLRHQAAPT